MNLCTYAYVYVVHLYVYKHMPFNFGDFSHPTFVLFRRSWGLEEGVRQRFFYWE